MKGKMKTILTTLILSSLSFSQLDYTVQLFGPIQHDGRELNTYGTTYVFIGDALSANTKWFHFSEAGYPKAKSVIWKHIWTPQHSSACVRLVHADNGPTNVTEIVDSCSPGGETTPKRYDFDITSAFNTLVEGGVDKQIGFQQKDSLCCGNSASSVYESRLEIIWGFGL